MYYEESIQQMLEMLFRNKDTHKATCSSLFSSFYNDEGGQYL